MDSDQRRERGAGSPGRRAPDERRLADVFAEKSKKRPPIFGGRGLATAAIAAIAAVLLVLQLLGVSKSAPAEKIRREVEGRAAEPPPAPPAAHDSGAPPPGLDRAYESILRAAADHARGGDADAIAQLPSLAGQAPEANRRAVRGWVLEILVALAGTKGPSAAAARAAGAHILTDDPDVDPKAAARFRAANEVPSQR